MNFNEGSCCFAVTLFACHNEFGGDGMKKREESTLAAASFALGIGISFAVIIGVGIFIGKWIDEVFLSSPWGILGGIVLGVFTGMWSVYKRLVGKNKK